MSLDFSFSFEEQPQWREPGSESTSQMITQITKWRLAYERLPQDSKSSCSQLFSRAMAVKYVHNSNVGEMVGTQRILETEEIIRKLTEDSTAFQCDEGVDRSVKETMNTYKAMESFHRMHEAMENTGFLTVQDVCDIHEVLLQGLHPDCGKIRSREAYTQWHGGHHFYPEPKRAQELFYALIDHHNAYMATCESMSSNKDEYTAYIFKRAACLLFEFVDIHPFGDGNGRMCRLLANYVAGLVTPFPVSLYHNPERNGRDDYLNAIVGCREHPEEGPRCLAAMLVEGAWRGWKNLFENLKARDQLECGIIV